MSSTFRTALAALAVAGFAMSAGTTAFAQDVYDIDREASFDNVSSEDMQAAVTKAFADWKREEAATADVYDVDRGASFDNVSSEDMQAAVTKAFADWKREEVATAEPRT